MKPFNRVFVVIYYVVGFIAGILHPVTVEGMDRLPDSGVLLCPNHASNWDPILVALKLPINYRLHIMAKEELFKNPLLGWLLRKVGAFPVSRGNNDINTIRTAIQSIKDGDNLLVFPEGTTIHDGIGYTDGLPAHAKAGVAMIGVRTGAKLVPVFVDGEKKLFHRTRIIFGEPYQPHYTGRRGTSDEMQKIADDILAAAYALGGQAVGGKPL
ncbi:MAG: 1-acyl-sn-glycerol-3-phosphate acyltransferase [Oscillibacter sp.]|jgi:1-acyl-sn-glycerol-3-phosphate acyltransferase|uniref:lysophospholipid acyltransferase family protein n=1 Tax=uncultured Oscillibacter sp. TaxID=876091 RepID=UPI00216C1E23|nr:lysophospholipid acyltransferase family protein [uncultured Oscillibacter sp.]MCI8803161.1 1-acyl-sn-glycerol-3-phosphate acyltransferase [Oscillibacter sp.]